MIAIDINSTNFDIVNISFLKLYIDKLFRIIMSQKIVKFEAIENKLLTTASKQRTKN